MCSGRLFLHILEDDLMNESVDIFKREIILITKNVIQPQQQQQISSIHINKQKKCLFRRNYRIDIDIISRQTSFY